MKKRLISYLLPSLILASFISCQHKGTGNTYLNGKIEIIEFVEQKNIKGTLIELNDAYRGSMIAYDSLLIIGSGENDHAFNIFSLHSGNKIGGICQIGQGPNDFIRVSISNRQLVKQGNDLCMWVGNYINSYSLVNITASLKKSSTIITRKMSRMPWAKQWSHPFGYSFMLDNGYILARSQAEENYVKMEEGYTPIAYHLYKDSIENCEKDYVLYKKDLIPQTTDDYMWVRNSLLSYDALHPNHKKIAMGMSYVGQLNILNIESGEIKGYRLKNSEDFDFLTKNPQESCTVYYNEVLADEKYIYASYCGEKISEIIAKWNGFVYPDIIHVFDWEGKPIIILHTDKHFKTISFDPVYKKLYTKNQDEDIYCYNMDFLY